MAARITAYLVACIVGVTLIAGLIVRAQRAGDDVVDLIVVNGKVYAGGATSEMGEAIAIRGNKVVRVGSNREIQRLRRAQTKVIDANGGAVVPGFNDAHAHFISGGLGLDQINLLEATTLDEIKDSIRVWSAAHPERTWITGRGWYYQPFAGALPTRQLLDALVPDRPAYLIAYDGHTGWANSRALKAAGITRRTKPPANGVIVKDPRTGEPTGALQEAAMALMTAAPQPTTEDKIAAIRAGMVEAHRVGITSVQNAGGTAEDLDLYDRLRKRGELTLRVYQALSVNGPVGEDELAQLAAIRERFDDDPLLKTGAVKLAADGVIESHTAAMLEPYANRPGISGDPRFTAEELNRTVTRLDREGWQVMTHAIGDAAVRMTLDAYEAAAGLNPAPERGRRHRIEHIETIDPADIPRLGALGVIASMEPVHATPSPTPGDDVWSINIGPVRAARGWLWNSIVKAGGRLAFGSDWPVMTLDPMMGLHVAVNRTTAEGLPEGGWLPDERLTVRQAIDAYTSDAAWASYDDLRKGILARDMLADLVILSEDIFDGPTARLSETLVMVTIVDGKVVYQREPLDTTVAP